MRFVNFVSRIAEDFHEDRHPQKAGAVGHETGVALGMRRTKALHRCVERKLDTLAA